ncbi:MAG TPA: hypothetical protein EYP49_05535 [Anaerolineae bacterium]|nr:hypothetical protein [Anaerolineae bacterium]
MSDIIPLPHYPQSAEGLCLAACARMVLAYWGTTTSEEELTELLGIKNWGAPASAIQRLPRFSQREWDVDYGCGTLEDLRQWLQNRMPVIVFVRTGFLEHWTTDVGHAVVVVGVTDEGVYIHDPAMTEAPTALSITGFEAAWIEMDYSYALIIPTAGEGQGD